MNVAVVGYGTVGSGVVEIINTKHSYINERTSDQDLEVKYILPSTSPRSALPPASTWSRPTRNSCPPAVPSF